MSSVSAGAQPFGGLPSGGLPSGGLPSGGPVSAEQGVVLAHREQVAAFPLDDEMVLYEPDAGATFVLNPTAAFIWSLCDGDRTLSEVAEDLADAYGIDEQQALSDVTALVENLRRAGFLTLSPAA